MSWYDDKPVYYDKRPGLVKLPHDSLVKDPDKLAKLSGGGGGLQDRGGEKP